MIVKVTQKTIPVLRFENEHNTLVSGLVSMTINGRAVPTWMVSWMLRLAIVWIKLRNKIGSHLQRER